MNTDFTSARVFTDLQGMAELKLAAKNSEAGALAETAKQFESLFIQMLLKTMREASISSGLFSSDQMQFHQEMFDQQLAIDLAAKQSLGIADMLVRQLGRNAQMPENDEVFIGNPVVPESFSISPAHQKAITSSDEPDGFDSPEAFIEFMRPLAEKVAVRLGVSADVLVAQSALETGWGKKIIQTADGENSHNLFGIKAYGGWQGRSAGVNTLEFRDGTMQQTHDSFRVYDSYAESFEDYARFLLTSPRYSEAVNSGHDSGGFITALQTAGYATDPEYADKVINILQRHRI